jgi:glutamine synthetase adenylyltransferase
MEHLTIDALRTMARAQGLELSDEDLAAVLPLVQVGRGLMESLAAVPLDDVEPSSQFRIF